MIAQRPPRKVSVTWGDSALVAADGNSVLSRQRTDHFGLLSMQSSFVGLVCITEFD
jgi:hypothetical protein